MCTDDSGMSGTDGRKKCVVLALSYPRYFPRGETLSLRIMDGYYERHGVFVTQISFLRMCRRVRPDFFEIE